MAYRAFGVRLAFLFGFALLIVLMQFLAVSRLNAPVQYPWLVDDGREGVAVKRTEQPLPLEHVSYTCILLCIKQHSMRQYNIIQEFCCKGECRTV